MTVAQEIINLDLLKSTISEISVSNNEPDCILKHRFNMIDLYSKTMLPERVNHLWKYLDPSLFQINNYTLSATATEVVLQNENQNDGVVFCKLKDAFKNESVKDVIKSKFGFLLKQDITKLSLLNEATWSCGYFLYLSKGVCLDKPLIATLNTCFHTGQLESSRVLIVLEDGASVNLIDEYQSCAANNLLSNVVVEVFLGKNSKLNYLNLQLRGTETIQHFLQRTQVEEGASFNNLIVALGGNITKADLRVDLAGELAECYTNGFVLGEGNQIFDHHTVLNHVAPRTKSGLDFRVALKDKSRSAYTGNLLINHEAVKCSAYQENRNLLLSPNAKAESIPELEIFTNDVEKCSHGVTMGQVDKDQIFYLRSRGLTEKEAERLIIEGFLEPQVAKIPDENLKNEVWSRVKAKIANV